MAAPLGNTNGSNKNRMWSDALRKELAGEKNAKELRKLAKVLIEEAKTGSIPAIRELGDRLEGKPAQTIQGPGEDGSFHITVTSDDTKVL